MSTFKPTKPQWSLALKTSPTAKWWTVGAGWNTDRGGITIRLNDDVDVKPFLEALRDNGGRMMLFPAKEGDYQPQPRPSYHSKPQWQPKAQTAADYMEQQRANRHKPTAETETSGDDPEWLR